MNINSKNIDNNDLSLNQNNNIINNEDKMNSFLTNEININNTHNNKPWSKLEKYIKIKKLNDYVDSIREKQELTIDEGEELKKYLRISLDRKKLLRIKEVQYDKEKGKIINIPILHFYNNNTCNNSKNIGQNTSTKTNTNKSNKKFTLKSLDKKDSTLKNLATSRKRIVKLKKKTKTKDKID